MASSYSFKKEGAPNLETYIKYGKSILERINSKDRLNGSGINSHRDAAAAAEESLQ